MNSHSSISELVTHERPALSEVGRVLPIQPDHEHRRSDPTRIDRPALERAVSDMLAALGVDATAESLRETPRRMAGVRRTAGPRAVPPTTFPNDGGTTKWSSRATSRFGHCASTTCCRSSASRTSATCRRAHLGLSKLARVVEHSLPPAGAGAADRADRRLAGRGTQPAGRWSRHGGRAHLHDAPGAQGAGTRTVTSALRGTVRDDPDTQEFLALPGRCAMPDRPRYVIIGASLAGATAAAALRVGRVRRARSC